MTRDTPWGGRRRLLLATAGLTTALAGCAGSGGAGDGSTPTRVEISVSDYPAVEEWLTETAVVGADDTYDGTIVDRRGRNRVEVGVGTEGNGGDFAFGPSAVAVSPGTTVRWVWTGLGGAHNVEAEPEDQIGESDYELSSGEAVVSEGTTFERTLGDPGIALYHCEPHLSLGMKGAVVVAE
jgi:halocyanin-like protein